MPAIQFYKANAVSAASSYDSQSLTGKSVVITGAASGIGEACMRSFAAAGAFVTFGDLAEDRAQALVSELGQNKVAFAKCDTRSWHDQVTLFKAAIEHSPSHSVDIVLANAGISGLDPIFQDQSDPATGEPVEPDLSILNTNLIGFMYTTKLALHYFARQPEGSGHDRCLIMTSSIAGYADHNGAPQYSAAKFGVRGMMRSLRQVLAKQQARVNIIAPWFIGTRIISGAALEKLQANNIPFAQVEDAATAVLHLASDASINGEYVPVDAVTNDIADKQNLGRALAIMPREFAEGGYVDLEMDDDNDGGLIADLQKRIDNVSIRVGAK